MSIRYAKENDKEKRERRKEREGKREKERQKERYREGGIDKRERERDREVKSTQSKPNPLPNAFPKLCHAGVKKGGGRAQSLFERKILVKSPEPENKAQRKVKKENPWEL